METRVFPALMSITLLLIVIFQLLNRAYIAKATSMSTLVKVEWMCIPPCCLGKECSCCHGFKNVSNMALAISNWVFVRDFRLRTRMRFVMEILSSTGLKQMASFVLNYFRYRADTSVDGNDE